MAIKKKSKIEEIILKKIKDIDKYMLYERNYRTFHEKLNELKIFIKSLEI